MNTLSKDFNIIDTKPIHKAMCLTAKPTRISECPDWVLTAVGSPSFIPLEGLVAMALAYNA